MSSSADNSFVMRTPVLLIGFNRARPLRQVFETIRQARPPKLYFAADGPRNEQERPRCEEVRALVKDVDWPCEVHTRFNEVNLGLRKGVSSALDWFFAHEEEGIVLEDDTLPVPEFYRFCQEMLERYRTDERIWEILANNLMDEWPRPTQGSYYFSAHGYGAPWGWASWRRAWKHYDVGMTQWPELKASSTLKDFFLNGDEEKDVHGMFDRVHSGRMNSWSYQFDIARITNHALNIIPNVNLVDNIGFGDDGTHTTSLADPRNKRTARAIPFPLEHSRFILPDEQRDAEYFKRFIGSTPSERIIAKVKTMLPGGQNGAARKALSKVKRMFGR
ncbi:MAG TPA: nucleotide-diphospho-sugar transferase [Flavobacteriales bacterium]|nr:nucleotide-diphospho-sugar transferase [Flavobacteriales bacterium]